MLKQCLLLLVLFFSECLLYAQSEVLMGSQAAVTDCSFQIYDDGGATGDYSANAHQILTIFSNDPSNACVMVEIQSLDIDPSDTLIFYDGPDTNATVLYKINNSNYNNSYGATYRYAATIQNTTGAVTVHFKSDATAGGGGFTLFASCMAPCQRIWLELDSSLCSKLPQIDTDGYYYLDVCPYDTIHLAVKGVYPDNNFSYNQNDDSTTFHWDFGFGAPIDTMGGSQLDYSFTGQGYSLYVMAQDQRQCVSQIPVLFRVRTSKNPIRYVEPPDPICAGSDMIISSGYDHVSNVQLVPIECEMSLTSMSADTVFISDGFSCPPYGPYCRSYLDFNCFPPDDTISDADDILYLRIKFEHSAMEDLRISLVCPTGQVCRIHPDYHTEGYGNVLSGQGSFPYGWGYWRTNFGMGNRSQDGHACNDTVINPLGEPWNYVWSNNTTMGYQYANTPNGYCFEPGNVHYTPNPYWDVDTMSYKIDPTVVETMTHVYHPWQPFDTLVGCPLNGAWYIEILDTGCDTVYGQGDNGYVVEWELKFNPLLMPQDMNWSYDVQIDTTYLIGPGADGMMVNTDTIGSMLYTYRVIDEFGCEFDTLIPMEIWPSPHVEFAQGLAICHGDMLQLTPTLNVSDPNPVYHWSTGDETPAIIVVTDGDYSVTVSSTYYLPSGLLTCTGTDTVHVEVSESPVIDYGNSMVTGCAPLTIHVTNHSTPVDADYEWLILDGNTNIVQNSHQYDPTFEIEEPGHYTLYLKVTTQDGCVDSLIRWDYIRVNAQPIAEFAATPEISLMAETQGQVVFTNYTEESILTDPATNFYWDFDDGETDSTHVSPTHTFAQWGDYNVTLHIETESNCNSEIAHTVVIEQDLVFPNIITPNGDGINDVFAIENLNTNVNLEDPDEYRTNKLFIYDRWGKKVYSAKNYDTFSRDGQISLGQQFFDGSSLNDGVYYYSFYYKGKAKTVNYNGSLTIMR